MKYIFTLLICFGFFFSCKNDNLEELHPIVQCDTIGLISFASTIQPILNSSCGTNNTGCHQNQNSNGGCGLGNYTDVKFTIDNFRFLKTITHDPSINSSLYMPLGSSTKIDECSIQKIEAWLNRGRLNN